MYFLNLGVKGLIPFCCPFSLFLNPCFYTAWQRFPGKQSMLPCASSHWVQWKGNFPAAPAIYSMSHLWFFVFFGLFFSSVHWWKHTSTSPSHERACYVLIDSNVHDSSHIPIDSFPLHSALFYWTRCGSSLFYPTHVMLLPFTQCYATLLGIRSKCYSMIIYLVTPSILWHVWLFCFKTWHVLKSNEIK